MFFNLFYNQKYDQFKIQIYLKKSIYSNIVNQLNDYMNELDWHSNREQC